MKHALVLMAPSYTIHSQHVDMHSPFHMDQYGGGRLPFRFLGGDGIYQQVCDRHNGQPHQVLDASGGYASACLGTNNPELMAIFSEAVKCGYATDEVSHPARERMLTDLFGINGLWSRHFASGKYHIAGRNSGSEGMELALRLLAEHRFDYRHQRINQRRDGKDIVLAFEGAWHGWTAGLVHLLNRRHYRVGLVREAAESVYGLKVKHIPFGSREYLEDFFRHNGMRLAAIVLEPIQGDAGVIPAPLGYLRRLTHLAQQHDALVIADEVLTFAKTGKFFAMADEDGAIDTDITVIGKSLGMGLVSVSLVIARDFLTTRATGAVCTSDLRPSVCELLNRGMNLLDRDQLVSKATDRGTYLRKLIHNELIQQFPNIYYEVRGEGLLNGIELTEAAAPYVRALRMCMMDSGIYLEAMAGAGKRSGNLRYIFPALRLTPPLTISDHEIQDLVTRLVAGTKTFKEDHNVNNTSADI